MPWGSGTALDILRNDKMWAHAGIKAPDGPSTDTVITTTTICRSIKHWLQDLRKSKLIIQHYIQRHLQRPVGLWNCTFRNLVSGWFIWPPLYDDCKAARVASVTNYFIGYQNVNEEQNSTDWPTFKWNYILSHSHSRNACAATCCQQISDTPRTGRW